MKELVRRTDTISLDAILRPVVIRLLIQKNLIKSGYKESSPSQILELNQDFFDKVRTVKEYGILDEFIGAAKEVVSY